MMVTKINFILSLSNFTLERIHKDLYKIEYVDKYFIKWREYLWEIFINDKWEVKQIKTQGVILYDSNQMLNITGYDAVARLVFDDAVKEYWVTTDEEKRELYERLRRDVKNTTNFLLWKIRENEEEIRKLIKKYNSIRLSF